MLKWPETMDEEQLRYPCFNIFVFIDATGGTSRGIFRYMHSRSLYEAVQITGGDRFNRSAGEFQRIDDRRQVLAAICKCASGRRGPGAALAETGIPLLDLADLEAEARSQLREWVQ